MAISENPHDTPDIACLLATMKEEYNLAQAALKYFRPGKRTNAFIQARHEAVTLAHLRLAWLIGRERATREVCHFFQNQLDHEQQDDHGRQIHHEMILDQAWLSLILVAYRLEHDQIVQPITFPPSDELVTRLLRVLSPVFTELCLSLGEREAHQRLQAILAARAPGQTDEQFGLGQALALKQLKTLKLFRQARVPDPTAGEVLLLRMLQEYTSAHAVAGHLRFEPGISEDDVRTRRAKEAFCEERFQAATTLHLQLARLVGLKPAASTAYAFLASKVNLDLTVPNLWLSPILATYRIRHERLIQLLRSLEKQRATDEQDEQQEVGEQDKQDEQRGEQALTEREEMAHWLLSTLEDTFRTLSAQLGATYTQRRIMAILDGETPLTSSTLLFPQVLPQSAVEGGRDGCVVAGLGAW